MASAGIPSLVDTVRKKAKFKQLAMFSIQANTNACKAPFRDWEQNLEECIQCEGVEALIAAGADVNMVVRNEDGDHITALDIVERYGEDSERHTGAKAARLRAGAKHAAEMEAEEGETQKEDL